MLEKVDRYLKLMEELDLKLVKAVDTHLHADHITGLGALRDRTRCVTVMGEQSKVDVVSMRIADGDRLTVEGLSLDALYTPGHTDDFYSFVFGDRVFTGDTLLIRGTGRTDFQNGDSRAQYESLQRLMRLPEETLVFPAHDYKGDTVSTIGEEKRFNPRLKVRDAEEYAALMASLHLPNPKMMDVAVPANIHQGLHQEEVARRGWAFSAAEAKELIGRPDVALIDLREKSERERTGAIPGSLHAPYAELQDNIDEGGLIHELSAVRQDDRLLLRLRRAVRHGGAGRAGQGPRLGPTHRGRHGGLDEGGRAVALREDMSSAQRMHSYKLAQFGEPLREVIESPPVPTGTQVLLRVRACGVCHSDIHISEGYFNLGRGQKIELSRAVQLPRILGHEIVGVVDELGPEASGVGWAPAASFILGVAAGSVRHAKLARRTFARGQRTLEFTETGVSATTYSSSTLRYLIEFDPLPETFAATLACSGLTAFSALKKAAPVDALNPLLIIGAGGLGLAAINLSLALYGVGPVVADIDASKRKAALDAGASSAVDPADPDIRQRLMKETGGFSAAIDFVGAESTTGFGLALLRKGGRIYVVGLFGGSMEIPLATLPLRAVGVVGSFVGSLPELRELLALARDGRVKSMPIESRPLDAAQQSLDDLRAGRVRGRVVLIP